MEGGRNIGSSSSSSEESSSDVNMKGETSYLSAGMGTWLGSPLSCAFHRLSISLSYSESSISEGYGGRSSDDKERKRRRLDL